MKHAKILSIFILASMFTACGDKEADGESNKEDEPKAILNDIESDEPLAEDEEEYVDMGLPYQIMTSYDYINVTSDQFLMPSSEFDNYDTIEELPNAPIVYQVHAGGGEGEGAVAVLEITDGNGTVTARLFYTTDEFGDSFTMTGNIFPLEGNRFAVHEVVDKIDQETMKMVDGVPTGDMVHEEFHKVYEVLNDTLNFVEEITL